ncbi:hypothetical protein [Yoonia vestfoldensis]|uniref:hypothetical protein n=1 Tax=Yoonia vestfoldensis TaxID=245188 RepID=UPI000366B835|nr:hypothetical protein [Yoonia vestfoldensis]
MATVLTGASLALSSGSATVLRAETIVSFAHPAGFLPIDPAYFWSEAWNGPQRFPNYDHSSIFYADVSMHDVEKAILAIDALDGPLPQVRYRISSRDLPTEEDWKAPLRLVEVTRFDLAPTVAAQVAVDYAGIFTPVAPDPAPHVTWRFVFDTHQGMGAAPIAIGRRILPEPEAAAALCFALSCLDLADPVGDSWDWKDITIDETSDPPVYHATDATGLTVPARIAALLVREAVVRGSYEMVISSGVVGQDSATNGILRHGIFVADEVISDWLIRREVAGTRPSWQQLRTSRLPGEKVWTFPDGFDPGPVDWVHIPVEGLDAWDMTLSFDTGTGDSIRYRTIANAEVATFQGDTWMYFGLAQFPGFVYAKDPGGGIALPVLGSPPPTAARRNRDMFVSSIIPTGRQTVLDGWQAEEYRLLFNMPVGQDDAYLVWSGTFWATRELPHLSGWFGLPGSPFAGRSDGFRGFWQSVGWDLEAYGLILRAEIHLHEGLVERDLRDGGVRRFQTGQMPPIAQTIRVTATDIRPDASYPLAVMFPDLARLGQAAWPYPLPDQPVATLTRY